MINNIFLNNGNELPIKTLSRLSAHKNYIIANSSFSLIAAVLSLQSHKKIIYPKPWFRGSNIHIQNIPNLWIPEKNI